MMPSSLLFSWFLETSLIAGVLALLAVFLSWQRLRLGPAMRHALWLVVLIKFLTPPLIRLPLPDLQVSSTSSIQAKPELKFDTPPFVRQDPVIDVVDSEPIPPPTETESPMAVSSTPLPSVNPPSEPTKAVEIRSPVRKMHWSQWVLSVWVVGALTTLVWQFWVVGRFQRRVRRGLAAPEWLEILVEETAKSLNVRMPKILLISGLSSPSIWCFGRPRLLIPENLLGQIDAKYWRMIIAHELAHLARRDHWTIWLELIAAPIWWWNPLFWLVRHRLRIECDRACDARVAVSWPDLRRVYAEAIVEICQSLTQHRLVKSAPALSFGDSRLLLERRLIMILSESSIVERLTIRGMVFLVLLIAMACPSWSVGQIASQPPRSDKPGWKTTSPSTSTTSTNQDARSSGKMYTATTRVSSPSATTKSGDASTDMTEEAEKRFLISSAVADAKDVVENAKAQYEIKKAELLKLEREEISKNRHLDELKKLAAAQAYPESGVKQAEDQLESHKTTILIKRSEVKQAFIAMETAERKLKEAPTMALLARMRASASNDPLVTNPLTDGPSTEASRELLINRIKVLEDQVARLSELLRRTSRMGMGGGLGGGNVTALNSEIRSDSSPKSVKVLKTLDKEIAMPFGEATPLNDVLQYLKETARDQDTGSLVFYLDPQALKIVGDNLQIKLDLENVSIRTGLGLLLSQLELTYCVRDGIIIVTQQSLVANYVADTGKPANATNPGNHIPGSVSPK